jgi:hypothetical protein
MYTEAVIRNEDAAGDGIRVMTFSCPRTEVTEETLHGPYCSKKWSIKYTLPCVGGNRFGTIMLDAFQCLQSIIQRFQSLLYSCVVPVARDTCHCYFLGINGDCWHRNRDCFNKILFLYGVSF